MLFTTLFDTLLITLLIPLFVTLLFPLLVAFYVTLLISLLVTFLFVKYLGLGGARTSELKAQTSEPILNLQIEFGRAGETKLLSQQHFQITLRVGENTNKNGCTSKAQTNETIFV